MIEIPKLDLFELGNFDGVAPVSPCCEAGGGNRFRGFAEDAVAVENFCR